MYLTFCIYCNNFFNKQMIYKEGVEMILQPNSIEKNHGL